MFSGSDEIPEGNINLNTLYSPYAVLVNLESGNVLAEQNSAERMYPASLTKIMTALIAIEETEDMEQTTTLPSDIFPSLYEENASLAGFQRERRSPGKICYTVSCYRREQNVV